jgi:hypothetical protein
MYKETFEKALNTGRYALQHGYRKLKLGDTRKAERYLWECYNWLAQNNPTEEQVKQFIQQHKDWLYLIIPNSKAGKSLKQKLFA